MKAEARQTSQRNHHAIATAGTGTGVLDCDGGEAGVSASLLNICRVHQETVSRPERIEILRRARTFTNTGADCPPLTAHFPSMIVKGTPVTPFARASAT